MNLVIKIFFLLVMLSLLIGVAIFQWSNYDGDKGTLMGCLTFTLLVIAYLAQGYSEYFKSPKNKDKKEE